MTRQTKLLTLVHTMQGKATDYLVPETYESYDGTQRAHGDRGPIRDRMFSEDMIYLLDGPEQREAEAEAKFDYVAEANLTLSNQYHGELVPVTDLKRIVLSAIAAMQQLDRVKKSLFYGRPFATADTTRDPNLKDNNFTTSEGIPRALGMCMTSPGTIPEVEEQAEIIIHGIIGLATEAGELLELLAGCLWEQRPFDPVNLKEEIGDGKWYMAILAKVAGFEWGDDERVNIAKLRSRFPNAFSEYDANNRDLHKERTILEQHPEVTYYTSDYGTVELKPGETETEAQKRAETAFLAGDPDKIFIIPETPNPRGIKY